MQDLVCLACLLHRLLQATLCLHAQVVTSTVLRLPLLGEAICTYDF